MKFPNWLKKTIKFIWRNIFIIAIIIFFLLLIIFSWYWVFYIDKNIIKGNRDLLSIYADIGKASGALALLGLMYQVLWREQDRKRRVTPKLVVKRAEMEKVNRSNLRTGNEIPCFCETRPNDLLTGPYRDFAMNVDTANGDRMLVIELQNQQPDPLGDAKDVKLELELTFISTIDSRIEQTFSFGCPDSISFLIPPSGTKSIYINCSLNHDSMENMGIIKGVIKNYSCRNSENRLIDGKNDNSFVEYLITEQPLWENDTEQTPPLRTATPPPHISAEALAADFEDDELSRAPEDDED